MVLFQILVILAVHVLRSNEEENYDDDIDRAYPAPISYRTFPADQTRYLEPINNCSCKELGGIDVHCFGSMCNTFPAAMNATVKMFKLKLTSVAALRPHDFSQLAQLVYLEINANVRLVRIEPGCFLNMSSLRNLTLVANINLKSLAVNVFEGLVNVEQMMFQKNGFARVLDITHALATRFVPHLGVLDIGESMFQQVRADEFHPMNGTALSQLNLVLCEIEFIHPDCFEPLRNVSTLRLGQNIFNVTLLTEFLQRSIDLGIPLNYLSLFDIGLRKIVPHYLMDTIALSNITYLSLAHNHFDYIDDKSFPTMPKLVKLDLRANYISDISLNAFRKLDALESLYLGENKLLDVPKAALLQHISYLDLSGNTLDGAYFNIEDGVFSNMSHLNHLQLSYNYLNYLTRDSFVGLTNLLNLNLKSTSINYIEIGTFLPLKRLIQLNLMNNQFRLMASLSADIFEGLDGLQVLLLGGCDIRNLTATPSIFSRMPNLTYLGLESSGLRTIAPGQLSLLQRLRTLNLADNKLANWAQPILPHAELRTLYLQQNKLSYVTAAMLTDWQHLHVLYIDGNPFTCDCTLYPIVTWVKANNVNLNFTHNENIVAKCNFPEMWRQRPLVDFLKNLTQDPSACVTYKSDVYTIVIFSILAFIILFVVVAIFICTYKCCYKNICADDLYRIK